MKNIFIFKSATIKSSHHQIIKLFFFLSIFLSFNLYSQDIQIPNGSFETWTSNFLFENPTGYYSSNYDASDLSLVNVSRSTDKFQGAYAVKVETKGTQDFVIPGYLFYGTPPLTIFSNLYNGGFPYVVKADSITGFFKYNLSANDSAVVFVIFKKNGQYIKSDYDKFKIYGVQNTFKKLSFKISNLNITPDTAIVGIMSSNPEGESLNLGNWIIADNISFVKGTTSTLIPNGDFENWTPVGRDEPTSWQDLNSYIPINALPYCSKTSDKHSGSSAINISTTEMEVNGNIRPVSFITTGRFVNTALKSIGSIADRGFKVISNPDSLSLYYKYDNVNNERDSALVIVSFTKDGIECGNTIVRLGPTDVYKKVSFKLNVRGFEFPPNTVVDTANIILSSSDYFYPDNIGIGNNLIIDDLKFIYKAPSPTGHKIAGTITYDNTANTLLTNNIKVYLKNSEKKKIDSTYTDAAGKYQFNNVLPGTYTLDGTSLKKYFNSGPSQGLLAMKSFVGLYTIKNALRKRAADVNLDNKINATDALTMNKRFVGIITTFKLPFWIFENPTVIVGNDDMTVDLKGLCAGDIGGAYTPPAN